MAENDGSSGSEDEADEQRSELIVKLRRSLKANPYHYDSVRLTPTTHPPPTHTHSLSLSPHTRLPCLRLLCQAQSRVSVSLTFSIEHTLVWLWLQHILFIKTLKEAAELEQLRHARTKMADVYPLTEGTTPHLQCASM
jgi:hypothetical protein